MTNVVVLRDLTDDELDALSDDLIFDLSHEYMVNGFPERATIKGLLEEMNIKYDDLSDFILELPVGICNYANRTDNLINIYRKDSKYLDNIVINLDDGKDIPDVTIQVQASDSFVHEEAYTKDGLLIYQS